MRRKVISDEYFLDQDGYYVAHELFKGRSGNKKCPFCEKHLYVVHREQYLKFANGVMVIVGIKVCGFECDLCNCGFVENYE